MKDRGFWSNLFPGSRLAEYQHKVFSGALDRLPNFLREATGLAPWFRVEEFYRLNCMDVTCTRCEIDCLYVTNNNGKGETVFAGVHYIDGETLIDYDGKVLFKGDPLDLMGYQIEGVILEKLGRPPDGCGLLGLWNQAHRKD